jgi:hypothetical protein
MASQTENGYEYDDDTVYSLAPPNADDEYNSMPSDPLSRIDFDDGNDRPSTLVKACKNIRVVFIHDLSGSMSSNVHTMVTGTNEFIEDLKARYAEPCEYHAEFLLITFSGDNISVGKWRNVKDLDMYTSRSFECHGTTPLWDACDIGLEKIAADCADCTAALYVFTDGDDNNSKKATRASIRERVASLDSTKQTMLFIGSDPLSSERNAKDIGLDRHRSLNPSTDSTPSAMRACTNSIARCVTGDTQTPEFNDDDIIMSEGSY